MSNLSGKSTSQGRRLFSAAVAVVGVSTALVATSAPFAAAATSCTPDAGYASCLRFAYTGADQTFTVPSGATKLKVEVWGGGGGGNNFGPDNTIDDSGGGAGGYGMGLMSVSAGQNVKVVVGGGGKQDVDGAENSVYGGGGAAGSASTRGGSGGGLSGVFTGGSTAELIAGGGGGGNGVMNDADVGGSEGAHAGGGGGAGLVGGEGIFPNVEGRGGTLSAGGAAATGNPGCTIGSAGSSLTGGAGGLGNESGGGGGGGYFGGGGGSCQSGPVNPGESNGPGGGGSGFSGGTSMSATSGESGENGTWALSDTSPAAALPGGISSPQYVSGIGSGGRTGASATNGGNGMVVIQYTAASSAKLVVNPVPRHKLPFKGTFVLITGARVVPTSAGSLKGISVRCRIGRQEVLARGDFRACVASKNLKTGRVVVRTLGYRNVYVTVRITTKSTSASYKPQLWTRTWAVRNR